MATKTNKKRRSFGQISRMRSGRYQARYTGPDGNLHTAHSTFEDRDAAVVWLNQERRLVEDSPETWTPPKARLEAARRKALTFGDFAKTWLINRKVKGRPLADRTRDHYRDLLDRFILPTFGEVALNAITPDMVDRWYELTAPDRPTTQAHAYGLLRTILGTAAQRGHIKTANPAHVRGGGTTKRRHTVKPATLKELAVIAANVPERRRVMILLAAWCGLRFGELAELRRKDIDLKNKIIRVRRGVVRVKTETGTARLVKTPKTDAGVRDVPIPPHVLPDLRAHLLEHTAPGRDGLLFPGRDPETHLTSSAFYGRASTFYESGPRKGERKVKGHGFFEARRLAGRSDLHFHDLRHTGLTNAAVAGATLAELMALAGHSTPGAAMRYQHAAQDRMQDLAAKLSALAETGVDQ